MLSLCSKHLFSCTYLWFSSGHQYVSLFFVLCAYDGIKSFVTNYSLGPSQCCVAWCLYSKQLVLLGMFLALSSNVFTLFCVLFKWVRYQIIFYTLPLNSFVYCGAFCYCTLPLSLSCTYLWLFFGTLVRKSIFCFACLSVVNPLPLLQLVPTHIMPSLCS